MPWIPICGAAAGLFQAVPGSSAHCCCAPWLFVAGLAATYMIVRTGGERMEPAEGAAVGLLTGLVAGVVAGVLGGAGELLSQSTGIIVPFMHDRRELLSWHVAQYLWAAAVVFLLYMLFAPILGTLGGLLGSAIWKPRPQPPPPT
jgi:hypothetical protein